jgi:hypothetical protein
VRDRALIPSLNCMFTFYGCIPIFSLGNGIFNSKHMLNSSFVEKKLCTEVQYMYRVLVGGWVMLREKKREETCRFLLSSYSDPDPPHPTPSNHGQCGSLPFLFLTLCSFCVEGEFACPSSADDRGGESQKKTTAKKCS